MNLPSTLFFMNSLLYRWSISCSVHSSLDAGKISGTCRFLFHGHARLSEFRSLMPLILFPKYEIILQKLINIITVKSMTLSRQKFEIFSAHIRVQNQCQWLSKKYQSRETIPSKFLTCSFSSALILSGHL
jgi:hypothetical protein